MEENKEFNEFQTAIKIMDTVSNLQEAKEAKANMTNKLSQLLKVTDEKVNGLDEAIKQYSLEELKRLSDDEIEKIYTIDGHILEFDIEIDPVKGIEFKRDFLVYMKQLDVYGAEMDNTINSLEDSLKEHNVEYKQLMDKYGSMYVIVKNQINETLKNSTDELKITRGRHMLNAMDNAITLNNLIEYVNTYSIENILKDFNHRGIDIYKKYKVVTKKLGIRTDITKLAALEEYLKLPEEYLKYNNLCMFLAIRYIAYSTNPTKEIEGMFISNLALVYKAVVEDSILPEDKEKLINGCKTIIDKFIAFDK